MITCPQLGKQGRLGNQLWQLASTLGIAHSHGDDEVSFPHWDYQEYFCVPDHLFDDRPGTPATDLVHHLPPEGLAYLQDYSLFKSIHQTVWEWFQPSEKARAVLAQHRDFWALEGPVTSLHVRRGDNANEGAWKAAYHPLRPMSYYEDALAMLDYKSVAVFSDDIEWCKAHFSPDFYFFEGGTPRPKEHEPEYLTAPVLDWIDLQLMFFCDFHVCSNSTFSYWSAFLSHDESPIYPWPYYGKALRMIDAGTMFPDTWRRLHHVNAD